MTWHLAKYGFVRIEKVGVVSDTASFVTLENGRREAKSTNYGTYHPTHEAAKQDILTRLYSEKTRLFEQVSNIERRIEEAEKL